MVRRFTARFNLCCLLAVLVLGVAPHAQAGVITYYAGLGTLPDAQGWTRFEEGPSAPAPTVTDGALHQGPTQDETQQYWLRTDLPGTFQGDGVTLDARMKVVASDYGIYSGVPRTGYIFGVSDDDGRTILVGLASDQIILINDTSSPSAVSGLFNTTDAFHDYQLRVSATGATLFIDGALFLTSTLGPVEAGGRAVFFGDVSRGGSESDLVSFSASSGIHAVPEPASLTLFGLAAVCLCVTRRKEMPGMVARWLSSGKRW